MIEVNKLSLHKLTFGSDDAELDEKKGFLDKVFLKTSMFERAKRSERELIIGRKGSGKSAICLMLKKAFETDGDFSLLVTPDSFSRQKLEQLKDGSVNEQKRYILGWKYVFLTAIGKQILEIAHKNSNRSKLGKYIRNIRLFLSENGEIAMSPAQRFREAASLLSKISIKAFGVEGSLEAKQLQKQIDLVNALNELQKSIYSALDILKEVKIKVLIDKVDDVWNQTKEAEMLVIGLIKSVHELNSEVHQVHLFLFIRSDIYDALKFEDADKLRSLEERVEWKERDLKHLIATRGKVSAGLPVSEPNDLWAMIFEKRVDVEDSFSYIYKRTLKRPRELIQFCNSAVAEAQDNLHECITSQDILKAEKQYSEWKYRDLATEFDIQYPYLEDILASFQGFASSFSVAQFSERFDETKRRLDNPEVSAISNEKMLQILFVIGFLGTKDGDENVFSYDDSSIILAQQETIIIHPAYRPFLGLYKSKSTVDSSPWKPITVKSQINIAGDIVGGNKIVQAQYDPTISGERELETLEEQKNRKLKELESLQKEVETYHPVSIPAHLQSRIDGVRETLDNLERKIASVEFNVRSQERNKYQTLATSKTPALIIYLLDVSGSMSEPFPPTNRIDAVTQALQKTAVKMVQRSTKGGLVAPRYRVAMLAYSSQVIDLLGGIKTIDELAKMGMPQLTTLDMTDTAGAFAVAEQILLSELPNMQDHPAPLICHMTDGIFNGGDPMPIAQRIMELAVPDGNVLIENIFVKSGIGVRDARNWPGISFPSQLPDHYSQLLLDMSSPLPDSYRRVMQEYGYKLDKGVKMFFPAENPELVELGFAISAAIPITHF